MARNFDWIIDPGQRQKAQALYEKYLDATDWSLQYAYEDALEILSDEIAIQQGIIKPEEFGIIRDNDPEEREALNWV